MRFSGPTTSGVPRIVGMLGMVLPFLLAAAIVAGAQTYSVLYSFAGPPDGAGPTAPVTLDLSTGNLYGTTGGGGTGGKPCEGGCGTVFELTSTGVESVLYSFQGPLDDGLTPNDVFRDAEGNLFGTTLLGGPGDDGIVFEIDPSGTETVLHYFHGGPDDGSGPTSGLIWDPNTSVFYGVTSGGGKYDDAGTVYAITATGSEETILYSFGAEGTLGNTPEGRLVQDAAGNLYGTLPLGGVGCGVVFELTPAEVETPLYLFTGAHGDGCEPGPYDPGLIMDADGNLYGTTLFGGTGNNGVVFELTAGGVEKVLYKFRGPKKGDGSWPMAGLAMDDAGNLYGTTDLGGTGPCINGGRTPKGCGTVFEISPPLTKHGKWRETILHSFTDGADGGYPSAGLVWDPQTGNLYGTATFGGTYDMGVVFEVNPQR